MRVIVKEVIGDPGGPTTEFVEIEDDHGRALSHPWKDYGDGLSAILLGTPAQQQWVCRLSIMMQSVLFASVRAPDGIAKDHPVKVLLRWYRRSILMLAFEHESRSDPFSDGGGSFTGPFTSEHFREHFTDPGTSSEEAHDIWSSLSYQDQWMFFSRMRNVYLRHVDELPHHFQLHFMHAAQIVGEYHPIDKVRDWWQNFYLMIVNDAHLFPEPREALEDRLGDDEASWRARENIITSR